MPAALVPAFADGDADLSQAGLAMRPG